MHNRRYTTMFYPRGRLISVLLYLLSCVNYTSEVQVVTCFVCATESNRTHLDTGSIILLLGVVGSVANICRPYREY